MSVFKVSIGVQGRSKFLREAERNAREIGAYACGEARKKQGRGRASGSRGADVVSTSAHFCTPASLVYQGVRSLGEPRAVTTKL